MERIEIKNKENIQSILSKYGKNSSFPFDEKTGIFKKESASGAQDGIRIIGEKAIIDAYYKKITDLRNSKYSRKQRKYLVKQAGNSAFSKATGGPYDNFSKSADAYVVAEAFQFKTCVYCNENYAYVLKNGKENITRPEFDHFDTKTVYPEKQLLLENLVPSCHVCNSTLKGKKDFGDGNHLNPHNHSFDDIMEFSVKLRSIEWQNEKNFEIIFVPKNKNNPLNKLAEGNINDLELCSRYNMHKNEVIKIFNNASTYYEERKNEMNELLSGSRNKLLPLNNLLFPDRNCSIKNTSLGKLKKDLIKKILK